MAFCSSCPSGVLGSRPGVFAALSRAAAKATSAKLRQLGVMRTNVNWTARAAACERCPLRVVSRGTSYCGTPFLRNPARDAAAEGCGCPTVAKAKDPTEHCPVNARHQPRATVGGCDCKWCTL